MPSKFGSPAAARVGDAVTHSAALWGELEGALVGAALGAILISTGGAAAPLLIAGAMATGASLGGTVGKLWGEHHVVPCGTIITGSPNVNINGRPAAFVGSVIACTQHPGPQMVAEGSATVRINGRPAARVGDHGTCGCVIAPPGSPNVFTGGAPVSPLGYAGEVPWVADAALLVLGLAGGGALMAVKGLGAAAVALKLGGSLVGSDLGAKLGRGAGGRLFGAGSRGQSALTFGGALVGGVGGGAVGGGLAGGAPASTGVRLSSSGDMAGVERAFPDLIAAVGRRRNLVIVEPGSDNARYLDAIGAEANVGGPNTDHILARPDPSKAALLEEFLHGTQRKLGLIDDTNLPAAEYHVKDFMIRHQRLLGLGDEDVRRLTILRDAGL